MNEAPPDKQTKPRRQSRKGDKPAAEIDVEDADLEFAAEKEELENRVRQLEQALEGDSALRELIARLPETYRRAAPKALASSLLAGMQKYPEDTVKRGGPIGLFVNTTPDTIYWLVAVANALVSEQQA